MAEYVIADYVRRILPTLDSLASMKEATVMEVHQAVCISLRLATLQAEQIFCRSSKLREALSVL